MAHVPDPVSGRPGVALRWIVIAAYSIILIILALIPASAAPESVRIPDWAAHGLAYGIQCILVAWGLSGLTGSRRAILGGFIGAVAFGVVTECLQLLRPDRAVEITDLVANTTGALLACCVMGAAACRFSDRPE